MTIPAVLKAWLRRGRTFLATTKGAFDLTSVLVGAAVVAILVGGTAVTTFGIIPWAQDNGAQQNLSAVSTAQGVAKVRDGKFTDTAGLTSASYLTTPGSSLAVGANSDGSCWVGFSRSDAGKTFYATADKTSPQPWASGTNTGCVDVTQQKQLARAVGTPMPIGYAAGWGVNWDNQLGTGALGGNILAPTQVSRAGVLNGKSMTQVSGGATHTCGIADGAAYCWGKNDYGQLGDGTLNDSSVPVAVGGPLVGKEVTAISVSIGNATCALAEAKLYCWGHNGWGKLGLGTGSPFTVTTPTLVQGALAGKSVDAVDFGTYHACAIADGSAFCWGHGQDGELGLGGTYNPDSPVAVSTAGVLAGKKVTAISAGQYFTCAIADEKPYCWGTGSYGQIGNGGSVQVNSPTAVDVSGVLAGKKATQITAGSFHACVIADGQGYCWGSGASGRLGAGTGVTSALVPVAVGGALAGKSLSTISVGDNSCAVADGDVYCWGTNAYGQNGTNDAVTVWTPTKAVLQGPLVGKKAIFLSLSSSSSTAVFE